MKWPVLLAFLGGGAPLACAGGRTLESPARAARSNATADAKATRADDFTAMTWEDRHDQMTWVVLPNMANLFQEFAATADATLTCRSCHGPDPESVAYRMPRDLPALDPAQLPLASDAGQRGRTARFMIETVTPTMAALLGEPRYDPKTESGFGCFKCHPAVNGAARSSQ